LIRVIVTEDGKGGNTIRLTIAETPLAQKDTIAPGAAFTGIVHYPAPYLTKPNLKLTSGKRKYEVVAETELGFTWAARSLPEDFREDARKDANLFEKFLGDSLAVQAAKGNLKHGLVFEDFTWEAKGLRAPASALPPRTFEQKGSFKTTHGQQGPVNFPIPYRQAPNVILNVSGFNKTVITECTPGGFKWKNTGADDIWNNVMVEWVASGIR
jgi:hypothetical protein